MLPLYLTAPTIKSSTFWDPKTAREHLFQFFWVSIIFDQVNVEKDPSIESKSRGNLDGKWDPFAPKKLAANPERASAAQTAVEAAFSEGLSCENRGLRAQMLA